MNIYEEVKKALQDIVAPELKAIQVEIKRLDEKIDYRFDSLRNELVSEIRRVDSRIDGLEKELKTAIDIRERLAVMRQRWVSN